MTETSFDAHHPSLSGHTGFLTIAEQEAKDAKKAAREAAVTHGESSFGSKGKSKELVIEELWRPSGNGVSFWEAAGVE